MSAAAPGREPGAGDNHNHFTVQAALMTTLAGRHLPHELALACSSFSSHVCVLKQAAPAIRSGNVRLTTWKCEETLRGHSGEVGKFHISEGA